MKGGISWSITTRGLAPIRLRLQRDHQIIAGFSLSASALSGEVRSRLATSARVISISPASINATAYRRHRKVLPITLGSLPQVATGYAIGDIELTPTEITVFASGKALDTLTTILTAPFRRAHAEGNDDDEGTPSPPRWSICLDQCGAGPCPRRATYGADLHTPRRGDRCSRGIRSSALTSSSYDPAYATSLSLQGY